MHLKFLSLETTQTKSEGAAAATRDGGVSQGDRLALNEIFIRCPRLGIPVSTGLTTRWVRFDSLPEVSIPLRCPACRNVHKWTPKDAWVDSHLRPGHSDCLLAS
jgi:hypothetical protein